MMYSLTVASMNCHGQSKIEVPKQLYIQNFLLTNRIDILMCQETRIDDLTFEQCNFIKSLIVSLSVCHQKFILLFCQ